MIHQPPLPIRGDASLPRPSRPLTPDPGRTVSLLLSQHAEAVRMLVTVHLSEHHVRVLAEQRQKRLVVVVEHEQIVGRSLEETRRDVGPDDHLRGGGVRGEVRLPR